MQSVVNIGMLGHVDHGKTSITRAITGVWTDTYSEEIKRGISIRIGYADASIYHCDSCDLYTTKETCPKCGRPTRFERKISFVDAPGHETLMTTAIAVSNIIDGAILVIAADEKCPQPQTKEHLMVLQAMGVKHLIVLQNKVDLVKRERALEHYNEIRAFLHEFGYGDDVPIIPVSATFGINMEFVLEAIQKFIPTPERDPTLPYLMYVVRSFDVNKPGTNIKNLKGGVIGGSLIQGELSVGDQIEIRPGIMYKIKDKDVVEPIVTEVTSLFAGSEPLETARPGGLIAIGTKLDPALTKGDNLSGCVAGKPGTLGNNTNLITIDYRLLDRTDFDNKPLTQGEPIVISVGTTTTIGVIAELKGSHVTIRTKREIYAIPNTNAAISRRVGQRWRLAGYGKVVKVG